MSNTKMLVQKFIDDYKGNWSYPDQGGAGQSLISYLTSVLSGGVVEIGCLKGKTSQLICDNLAKDKKLLCIDPYNGMQQGSLQVFTEFKEFLEKNRASATHIHGQSQAKESIEAISTHSYNLCFIDGLHTYSAALQDLENCYNHIDKPGIIILDDTNVAGVALAMHEFVNNPEHHDVSIFQKEMQHNPCHKQFEVLIIEDQSQEEVTVDNS